MNKKVNLSLTALAILIMSSVHSINDFECSTEVPTTSTVVKKAQGKVWLDYIHHNGVELAPIHKGIITLNDIQRIARRGQLIAKMGDFIKLPFEVKNCKVHEEGNYHCFSNEKITIGNLEVTSYGFFTHQAKSFIFGTDFTEFNFRLYVRTKTGIALESEMTYELSSNDCRFDKF